MAIYHLQVKTRSKGSSASAKAGALYILRQGKYARDIAELQHAESRHMPTWAQANPVDFWNAADLYERQNGRLYKQLIFALPNELGPAEQRELAVAFARSLTDAEKLPYTLAVHDNGDGNPHVHLMISERKNDGIERPPELWFKRWNAKHPELGGAQKSISLKPKAWLEHVRGEWAHQANLALDRLGHEIRIDHRSYAEQGIALEPQVHRGPVHRKPTGRTQERLLEHDRICRENGEAILHRPAIALDAITRQRATFTERDVARWLHKHTADAEQFQACLSGVMGSPEVVALGEDDRGDERFSTRAMLQMERQMLATAHAMEKRAGHKVSQRHIDAAARMGLSLEQRMAMEHVVMGGDLAAVQGYAGSGKSYMLGAARQAWESQGYRVLGAALAGKAAEGLQQSAGISARSLHAWQYAWEQGFDELHKKDVLVIDEAGMVGSRQLSEVLDYANHKGAKVVLVGDSEQLQAIEAGSPFRAIAERIGQVELGEIRRQREAWQRDAVRDFRDGDAKKALHAYRKRGFVHAHEDHQAAVRSMVKAWDAHRKAQPEQSQIMLAYRRVDVQKLNEEARALRVDAGELGPGHRIETERGAREFAVGDRVYFLRNDHGLGVKNGTLGVVQEIEGGQGRERLTIQLDGKDARQVSFNVADYNHLDHGYAATVHKAQGVTVDRAHVLVSDYFDRHVAYVAMSRHRDQVDLHVSKQEFPDAGELVRVCSRSRRKDIALDYHRVDTESQKLQQEIERTPVVELKAPGELKIHKVVFAPKEDARAREQRLQQARQVVQEYRQALAVSRQAPVEVASVMQGYTRDQRLIVDSAQFRVTQATHRQEQFAKEHPIKAKMGLGHYAELVKDRQNYEGELAQAQKKLRKLERSPELLRKAQAFVQEHNDRTQKAQERVQQLEPGHQRAQRELELHRKERADEIKLERDEDWGIER